MKTVIVIDTGLIDSYIDERVLGGCSVLKVNGEYIIESGYSDYIGHGTATTDIILKNSTNINVFVLRIYEEELFIEEDKLCFALEYAKNNLEYDMIQISSGLLTYSSKMHTIIKQIVLKDKKMVLSAFDNEGGISYPAAFEEVIGIDINHSYRKKTQYDIMRDNVIDIIGAAANFRVPWIENKKNIVNGTSFLTSYFTALIGELSGNKLEKKDIIEALKINAINIYEDYSEGQTISSKEFVSEIKHAITFPFNKEIYCLAAFEDILPFKIDGYYDIKHKFLIGKEIRDVLKYTNNENVIQNVENIDWNESFDSVICGHLSEISEATKKDYLNEILQKCRAYNKRVYVFDDLGLIKKDYKNSKEVFSPIIEINPNINNHFGKLRRCNKPVLAVMGTSSRQGKYTIQLNMFKEFKNRGIKVDGISTEPTGPLFGFSKTFACGYGSNNTLNPYEMTRVLNDMIYQLECEKNELIITGGQSGTIAYDNRNEALIPLEQYSYLTGVNPDGVILCVNAIDDFIYIKKTINFIESATNAYVFAIVVSPVHQANDECDDVDILTQLKEEYGQTKKYYRLENLEIKALVDNVIDYYE